MTPHNSAIAQAPIQTSSARNTKRAASRERPESIHWHAANPARRGLDDRTGHRADQQIELVQTNLVIIQWPLDARTAARLITSALPSNTSRATSTLAQATTAPSRILPTSLAPLLRMTWEPFANPDTTHPDTASPRSHPIAGSVTLEIITKVPGGPSEGPGGPGGPGNDERNDKHRTRPIATLYTANTTAEFILHCDDHQPLACTVHAPGVFTAAYRHDSDDAQDRWRLVYANTPVLAHAGLKGGRYGVAEGCLIAKQWHHMPTG